MAAQASCGLTKGASNMLVMAAIRNAFARPDLVKDSSLWFDLGLRRPVRRILYPPIALRFERLSNCRVPPAIAVKFAEANTIADVQALVSPSLV